MQIFPAIDLRNGKCVRLQQGDYARETVFDSDPVQVARAFVSQGASWLHVVDLDGAREGRPVNGDAIRAIVHAAGVPVQLGGGLRKTEHLDLAFANGITRCVIGTQALKNPAWFKTICKDFPNRIVLGIDAHNGLVATDGWLDVSSVAAIELARRYEDWPLAGIIYTDISKDGMLEGPNFGSLAEMQCGVKLPLIASGGITTLNDVARLVELHVAGCIVGRALYESRIQLSDAINLVKADSKQDRLSLQSKSRSSKE